MKLILLSILFINLISCLPQAVPTQTPVNNDSNATSSEEETPTIIYGSAAKWLNSGLSSKTLTLNVDNAKSVQIIGDDIHSYLTSTANFNSTYCLEAIFNQTNLVSPKRLRIKIIPDRDNNVTRGTLARFMRVNLNSPLGNDFCNKSTVEIINGVEKTIMAGDSDKDGDVDGNDTSVVYQTSDICTNCSDILSSNKFKLYKYNSSTAKLEFVDPALIAYESMVLRVDMNSNSDNGSSSCSNSACQSSGFDCCLQGQCINEKGIKVSGVQNNPSGFTLAEQEKYTDINWYKKYPQYYYSCLEIPSTNPDPDPITPEDPNGDADTRLEELIADYHCINELDTNSDADPFHINPYDSVKNYSACKVLTSEISETLYYKNVMKRMYQNCGCDEADDLDQMISICPAYTYGPIYATDSNGEITDQIEAIECLSPPVAQTPLPFSNLQVPVNSRSAPHRFFNKDNVEVSPESPIPSNVSSEQEGVKFQYLDDDKIFPNNGSFNMNSIIGQMTADLNQARPARIIDLEFDKQYYISTRSGFYSPCPNCAKDSWFSNFTSTPTSSFGLGLRASGYTTRRDTYSNNTSLGNYEDTIFGRACFLPPTMIPYGHSSNSNVQNQRLNRLQTQAALFMNGYQRDWYGFNKGALIASFDGATWFAVGSGRIVRSTSTKLYLAINAPFADLASPSDHIVSVQEYDFVSTGAQFDYDPTKEINDSTQNQGGSCQAYHSCESDSHCITKLGWEYSCAEVGTLKTQWPSFDPLGAKELANTSRTGTIIDFLQQDTLPPGSGTKRCIYRGAGSPCRVDYQNISDLNLRKSLTCAPNFHCANIDSSVLFNKEVARFGRSLDEIIDNKNHYYGQDANFLGRPKNYIHGPSLTSLPSIVKTNLKQNISLSDSGATGQMGLCRPGKRLPTYANADDTLTWNPSEQHATPDSQNRTDYISQIGSCNAALYTDLRYSSCPMLDESGNYIHTQDDFLIDKFSIPNLDGEYNRQFVTERYTFAQNACGLESLNKGTNIGVGISADTLANQSAFKSIEGRSLATSNIIVEKSLVQNACLRKAGAVCHTDLDCSPNRLQASIIDLVNPDFFGNTAEKQYYEEFLVCGQKQSQPNVGDSNFNSFNIHNNRCCRPIGSEITMFTEDTPDVLESQGLRADKFGALHPSDETRYSRYSVVDSQIDKASKLSNIIRPSANKETMSDGNANTVTEVDKTLAHEVNIAQYNQWRTIHTAAAKTCCGGSWVRKFADGTNDWRINRLNLDISKFKCLNTNTPLSLTEDPTAYGVTSGDLDTDRGNFCSDPARAAGGCSAVEFGGISDLETIIRPTLNRTVGQQILDSDDEVMANLWSGNLWTYSQLIPYDAGESLVLDWQKAQEDVDRKTIITRIPSYIAFEDVSELLISLENESGSMNACTRYAGGNSDGTTYLIAAGSVDVSKKYWQPGVCDPTIAQGTTPTDENCCYHYNDLTRTLIVSTDQRTSNLPSKFEKTKRSLRIQYTAPGTLQWELNKTIGLSAVYSNENNGADTNYSPHRRSSTPGNSLYYLKKLAHFEYIGIPQMTYEPIYCNDNYQNLVPGLFKDEAFGQRLETVADFLRHTKTFIDPRFERPWATDTAPFPYTVTENNLNKNVAADQELVEHSPIFSDNKIKCCMPLGDTVTDQTMCCSGYAVDGQGDTSGKVCKLPTGTNLNVFFNKFVSGEGISDEMDVAPLVTEDFDTRTGEPIVSTSVLAKLTALGKEYCESGGVRRGGAFGPYEAEPSSNRNGQSSNGELYSMIDSFADNGNLNNQQVGYQVFSIGYRWNHHLYCDLESE